MLETILLRRGAFRVATSTTSLKRFLSVVPGNTSWNIPKQGVLQSICVGKIKTAPSGFLT